MLKLRIAVCGGRDFSDRIWLFEEMDKLRAELGDFAVVTGGQRQFNKVRREFEGADFWAEQWARDRHLWYLGLTADWSGGLGGGPRRNRKVLDQAKPHRLVAFPGKKGTADMKTAAGERGIPITELRGRTIPVGLGQEQSRPPLS